MWGVGKRRVSKGPATLLNQGADLMSTPIFMDTYLYAYVV